MNEFQTPDPVAPEDKLLRVNDVLQRLPMSRSSWWNGVREGRYPRGIKLGPKTTCWRASDINALIRSL